jgi:hypothetical protein
VVFFRWFAAERRADQEVESGRVASPGGPKAHV